MSLYLVLGPFKALMIDLTLFWQSNIVWPLKKKNFFTTLRSSLLLKNVGRPGLVVMGGDTLWKSWVWISAPGTRWTFFILICCKIVMFVCLKRPKMNEKVAGDGTFKNTIFKDAVKVVFQNIRQRPSSSRSNWKEQPTCNRRCSVTWFCETLLLWWFIKAFI